MKTQTTLRIVVAVLMIVCSLVVGGPVQSIAIVLPTATPPPSQPPGATPTPTPLPTPTPVPTPTPIPDSVLDDEYAQSLQSIQGVYNILLVGVDTRTKGYRGLADTLIIFSIDTNNKKLKMTSIMRDLFVPYADIKKTGEERYGKINESMALGGIELLRATVEQNFKLKLHNHIIINFDGFIELIDSVNGLQVDLPQNLISPLNDVIGGTVKQRPDLKPMEVYLTDPGVQVLTGMQALAYARMRKNAGNDQARTDRQREVIVKLMKKFAKTPIHRYPTILNVLLKHVSTDMGIDKIASYAYAVLQNDISLNPEQLRLPLSGFYTSVSNSRVKSAIVSDLPQLAKILNRWLSRDIPVEKQGRDQASYDEAVAAFKEMFKMVDSPHEDEEEPTPSPSPAP